MPVSALMANIHMLSSNNNRNSIICDPGLGHCGLGILKRIPLRQIKRALKRHFFHSVIHLLILSGSQSVSQSISLCGRHVPLVLTFGSNLK